MSARHHERARTPESRFQWGTFSLNEAVLETHGPNPAFWPRCKNFHRNREATQKVGGTKLETERS